MARRAGVDIRTVHEISGWARRSESDVPYDHSLEFEQYERAQKKVARWLKERGYLG